MLLAGLGDTSGLFTCPRPETLILYGVSADHLLFHVTVACVHALSALAARHMRSYLNATMRMFSYVHFEEATNEQMLFHWYSFPACRHSGIDRVTVETATAMR